MNDGPEKKEDLLKVYMNLAPPRPILSFQVSPSAPPFTEQAQTSLWAVISLHPKQYHGRFISKSSEIMQRILTRYVAMSGPE